MTTITSSRNIDVPVLIVGGGPAGLTASLLLSRYGVESLLVDKRSTPSSLPRARGVHARAMEIMRVCGVEADLRSAQLPITPGAQWQSRLSAPPMPEDVPSAESPVRVSPCEGLAVSQDVFEAVLHAHATGYSAAGLRRGVLLESFELVDAGVQATLRDSVSGTRSSVRAQWLIAADGARSGIRDRLGITMKGADDLGRQQMIAFRADLTRYTGEHPRGIYFITDSIAALIWTHSDHRWVIHLPGNVDTTDAEAAVRQALGISELNLELLGGSRWTAAAQSASCYSQGPVFLVGDAAHQFPPAGATGVSTGMHDAHNLAWKIAAVSRGHAGTALLDSYRVEREPVGRRNADETGTAWTRVFSSGGGAPFAGRSLAQIDMGYQYRSAVITSEDRYTDAPGADYHPTATPGCRAPHLWIAGEGHRSTIDLFDQHHVLLTAPPGAHWRAAADSATRTLGVPVLNHVIDEPDWPSLYGVTPTGGVLVRPDGHVAWRCAAEPAPGHPAADSQVLTAMTTATGHLEFDGHRREPDSEDVSDGQHETSLPPATISSASSTTPATPTSRLSGIARRPR